MGGDSASDFLHGKRLGFNPRPRMGGDSNPEPFPGNYEFQSAPPHGGRYGVKVLIVHGNCVSIRAPAWGAIHDDYHGVWFTVQFQSAPPHGGR